MITLSSAEDRELRQWAARYSAPYMTVLLAKIILMAAAGLQNKEIAERLMLPVQIVTEWRKRYYHEDLAGLDERPRRGRQPTRTGAAADARS